LPVHKTNSPWQHLYTDIRNSEMLLGFRAWFGHTI
jgi:hypothetical protein